MFQMLDSEVLKTPGHCTSGQSHIFYLYIGKHPPKLSDTDSLIQIPNALPETLFPLPHELPTLSTLLQSLQSPKVKHTDLVTSRKTMLAAQTNKCGSIIPSDLPSILEALMLVVAWMIGIPVLTVGTPRIASTTITLSLSSIQSVLDVVRLEGE